MTIVIPMAGLSQRFTDVGFILPKYMLYIGSRSLFHLSLNSFISYKKSCKFLFIARDTYNTKQFIEEECKLLGIKQFEIVILEQPTRGQAETVYLGLINSKQMKEDEPITIFNIDTFRKNFKFPMELSLWDGYLEVFCGEGNNWSYAKTENESSTKVIETTEKIQISNYCSTGLYYFKFAKYFINSYLNRLQLDQMSGTKELYIAPLYNFLIGENKSIHINIIQKESVQFCGIPDEYIRCLENFKKFI